MTAGRQDGRPGVVVFAPLPPPVSGVRIATATFVELLREVTTVDVVPELGRAFRSHGQWLAPAHAARLLGALRRLQRAVEASGGAPVYFCPRLSRPGLVRDGLLTQVLRPVASRLVGHVHGSGYERHLRHPVYGAAVRGMVAQWDAVLVPSEAQAAALRPELGDKVRVVTNVVDPGVAVPTDAVEATLARRRDALHVVYVSNFLPSKGYDDVLSALARCAGPTRATFAGEWPSEAARRAFLGRIATLGLGDRVRLAGTLDRAAVRELLLDADVLTLPTSYAFEAQPLAVLEALQAGRPVVATAHASLPEYVLDGQTGILVPPRDPAALAAAFDRLQDPALRTRLGRAAHALARERFSAAAALPPLLDALGLPARP